MHDLGRDKITFRVSQETLNEIDELVNETEHNTRSDLLRSVMKKGRTKLLLDSSSIIVHSKIFGEILKTLKKKDLQEVTKKTATIIHSLLQNAKKSLLVNIDEMEALKFVKELYESTNMVKEMYYTKNTENEIIICITGDRLYNRKFMKYMCYEITNVFNPWFKLLSTSETPGNLVVILKQNKEDDQIQRNL